MLLYNPVLVRSFSSIIRHSRKLSIGTEISFKPKYTNEEQGKILSVLNDSSTDELSKFDITRGRLKHLEAWRNRNGSFHTLSDVLEVEGLGEKLLERLCDSIVKENNVDSVYVPKQTNTYRKPHVSPVISSDLLPKLNSVVSIHLSPIGVSWAKLSKDDNNVDCWDFIKSIQSPKKLLPHDHYEIACRIVNSLPDADMYVMEAISQTNTGMSMKPQINSTNLELSSMLLVLINERKSKLNDAKEQMEKDTLVPTNKVYFLKQYTSSKMFKTYVGNEKVSSVGIICKLLEGVSDFPCNPIKVNSDIAQLFLSESDIQKDLLGQALILAISFMELCVRKNPNSFQIFSRKTRNVTT